VTRTVTARVGVAHRTAEQTASGIYGLIVSSGVLAAGAGTSTGTVVLAVLGTLCVYWAAERYAELVAERVHSGQRLGWPRVRRRLASGWEIVAGSAAPLGVLVVFRAAGAALPIAVDAALVCGVVLLCLAGWEIGRDGRLGVPQRLASAATAGGFGVLMAALKTLLH
jgi:hypothetical protein